MAAPFRSKIRQLAPRLRNARRQAGPRLGKWVLALRKCVSPTIAGPRARALLEAEALARNTGKPGKRPTVTTKFSVLGGTFAAGCWLTSFGCGGGSGGAGAHDAVVDGGAGGSDAGSSAPGDTPDADAATGAGDASAEAAPPDTPSSVYPAFVPDIGQIVNNGEA